MFYLKFKLNWLFWILPGNPVLIKINQWLLTSNMWLKDWLEEKNRDQIMNGHQYGPESFSGFITTNNDHRDMFKVTWALTWDKNMDSEAAQVFWVQMSESRTWPSKQSLTTTLSLDVIFFNMILIDHLQKIFPRSLRYWSKVTRILRILGNCCLDLVGK